MIGLVYLCIFTMCSQTMGLQLSSTYTVDWQVDKDKITFHIEAKTKGWVGLGLNSKPGMTGADIVVAGVRGGTEQYIYDMHADGFEKPVSDSKQDYEMVKASENATHTILTISRPLDTADPNDYAITADPLYLLWAYHNADAASDQQFSKHNHQGSSQPVSLLNSVRVR